MENENVYAHDYGHEEHDYDHDYVDIGCDEYELHKSKKENNYRLKFKNRTKGSKLSTRFKSTNRHLGNCTSTRGSRPSAYVLCTSRLYNKKVNWYIKKFKIVDAKDSNKPYSNVHGKSILQNAVQYEEKPRYNFNSSCKKSVNNHKDLEKRIISLEKIHPHLYLGNKNALSIDTFKKNNIEIVIAIDLKDEINNIKYLSDDMYNNTVKYHNIDYEDKCNISYFEFNKIIRHTISLLDSELKKEKNILVVCEKGVNRSSSIVIAYAILMRKMTYNDVCDYVDTTKLKDYPYWNNLTNKRMRNLLKLIQ
jgi:protein-tyrosine phosphatase